ncbi:CBS domain-containing protein [Roseivirga sp. 4D4]|uniref:CBS domain-containing protein n=1 Tax=Roseivirga sp. 4D4 TaxID=1889784 RepID=UPI000852A9BF|nr:CBS domain-containing protein [Roseivirga sp. 4D4]OEK03202.1 CBS domain-containing protein [Roseivirga sp. 4D4]
MGDLNVKVIKTQKQLNDFTRCLLRDVHLMEQMIEKDWFETGQMHIGAEQEFCLIGKHYKPITKASEVLQKLDHPSFTTELGQFNIEANLAPQPFKGDCFAKLEGELNSLLNRLDPVCQELDIDYLLTGILPTLRKFDLAIENITPLDRYYALAEAIKKMRGKDFELHLKGYDELNLKFDSVMLEACNTSFQVHLQVRPDEFVDQYNIAQLLAGPTVAVGSNSPMLFGKRLWHETRIALFQKSVDTRITNEHIRDRSPRVMFGNSWLKNSVLDLFKEDISRFRVMLMTGQEDASQTDFEQGITPKLKALSIHNSTVYRWNRPCYGISPNGKPHLRIENRVLPSGPTVLDEMANTAFWLGAMNGFKDHFQNIPDLIEFDQVKSNFYGAATQGMNAKVRWLNGQRLSMNELILKELLPIAKEGLIKNKVNTADIDKYLDVIKERVEANQNGTNWILKSYSHLAKDATKEEILLSITSSMHKNQQANQPVHKWPLADLSHLVGLDPATILVEEFMTTDLFTVQQEDILELVADMMDWQNVRFTPVENDKGRLIGLISARMMLRHFRKKDDPVSGQKMVKDIMIKDPITIDPGKTVHDAMALMKANSVGCLPVVKNQKLIGIVTEGDFLNLTSTILKIVKGAGDLNE